MTWDPIAPPLPPIWPPTHHETLRFAFAAALDLSRIEGRRVSVKVAGRHYPTNDPQWRIFTTQAPGPSSKVES